MPAHKFAVGQKVRFTPDMGQSFRYSEAFTIVRLLPETDGIPQYQVKSDRDGHERVVRENQLAKL